MKTLFNNSDFQMTAQPQVKNNRRYEGKKSNFSHPNLRGIASKRNAQRALAIASAAILANYCGQALIQEQYSKEDGTGVIVATIWEDGENVIYQFEVDTDGDYYAMQL